MGSWTHMPEKRAANKATRRALAKEMPMRLADDYTYEELMADICRDDAPCEMCLRSMARKAALHAPVSSDPAPDVTSHFPARSAQGISGSEQ